MPLLPLLRAAEDADLPSNLNNLASLDSLERVASLADPRDPLIKDKVKPHLSEDLQKLNISKTDDFFTSPCVNTILDTIYSETSEHPFFKRIYETAAGFMFSTDPHIGVCVLFAYDYADKFYYCLSIFMKASDADKSEFSETTNEAALSIYAKLQR